MLFPHWAAGCLLIFSPLTSVGAGGDAQAQVGVSWAFTLVCWLMLVVSVKLTQLEIFARTVKICGINLIDSRITSGRASGKVPWLCSLMREDPLTVGSTILWLGSWTTYMKKELNSSKHVVSSVPGCEALCPAVSSPATLIPQSWGTVTQICQPKWTLLSLISFVRAFYHSKEKRN